jgi:anti-sigma B factor antagonist
VYQQSEGLEVLVKAGEAGDRVRIEARGELDLASMDVLRKALDAALEAPHRDVEIELSGLSFCDSTGLCLLLTTQRRLGAAGRALRLVNPTPGMLRLLDLSATHDLFEVRSTSSAADGHPRDEVPV